MTQATKFTLTITNSSNEPQNVSLFGAANNRPEENQGNDKSIFITYDNADYYGGGNPAYIALLGRSETSINKFFISKLLEGKPFDCNYIQHQYDPNGVETTKPLNFSSTDLINGNTKITYKHPANSKVVFEISFLS